MAIEYFPRKPISRPSTVIRTDTSALTGSATDSQKTIMLIGSAMGGKPNTPYQVRNIIQAKEIFRGGELLDALEMAWNPSNTSAGGGTILAMRVEDADPAEMVKGGVTFRTKLYGTEANGVEVSLKESAIGEGVRTLTVEYGNDNYVKAYNNIGDIIHITKEADAPAYMSVEVTKEDIVIKSGEAKEGAIVAKTIPLGIGTDRNANILANTLNNIEGITAVMPAGGSRNINTIGLDELTETEITEERVTLTALLADIHSRLRFDEYLEVVVPEENISKELSTDEEVVVIGGVTIPDFDKENLKGGSAGNIPETWASKFSILANEGGYYLVPLTDNSAIHAEAMAFVNERSAEGEPMRAIVGAGYDETPAQLLGRAGTLRDPRTMLIGFSGKNNLDDGRVMEIPAYMYAAQVAGIASGLAIGEAITFKDIRLTDLSTIFDSEQLDDLNSGGVVMAEFVRNRDQTNFRLIDDVTTFNDQSDPVKNQMGVGEGSDFLITEMKIMLDDNFIGTSVVNMSASLIKSSVQSFLDQKRRDNEIQDYNPEDIQVVINGEIANISVVVYPIRSLKRIEVAMVYRQQILSA